MRRPKLLIVVGIVIGGSILAWMWAAVTVEKQRRLAEEKKVRAPMLAEATKEPVKEPVGEQPEFSPLVEPTEEPVLVRVFKVKRSDFEDVLPEMGTIKGSSETDLRFEMNGVVSAINFREGDKVKKGDIIAALDTKDTLLRLEYAKRKFESAQATYLTTKKKLEIYQGLYEAGAIIPARLEEVRLESEGARLQAEMVKAEVELALSELDKTSLLAPKDGVIGSRDVEVGEFVTPNTKIASIIEIEEVFAEVGIVEMDIDKIKLGQKGLVNVDTYPGVDFEGRIDNIFPLVEGRSRTLTTKVKLSNPKGLLLPGMFARVRIFIVELTDAIMVPTYSLIKLDPTTNVVPVVVSKIYSYKDVEEGTQPGTIELRKVIVGYETTDYVQVVSGLKEGELVILEAKGELTHGVAVRVVGVEESIL